MEIRSLTSCSFVDQCQTLLGELKKECQNKVDSPTLPKKMVSQAVACHKFISSAQLFVNQVIEIATREGYVLGHIWVTSGRTLAVNVVPLVFSDENQLVSIPTFQVNDGNVFAGSKVVKGESAELAAERTAREEMGIRDGLGAEVMWKQFRIVSDSVSDEKGTVSLALLGVIKSSKEKPVKPSGKMSSIPLSHLNWPDMVDMAKRDFMSRAMVQFFEKRKLQGKGFYEALEESEDLDNPEVVFSNKEIENFRQKNDYLHRHQVDATQLGGICRAFKTMTQKIKEMCEHLNGEGPKTDGLKAIQKEVVEIISHTVGSYWNQLNEFQKNEPDPMKERVVAVNAHPVKVLIIHKGKIVLGESTLSESLESTAARLHLKYFSSMMDKGESLSARVVKILSSSKNLTAPLTAQVQVNVISGKS